MVKDRVRVKEPNPLQKPWISPKFRMAQLGQGRQRLKIFLPLDQKRKKSLFLQPKSKAGVDRIIFLVRQNLGFHPVPCVTHVRVWASHLQYHPYLLDCCQSKYGDLASLLLFLFHRRCRPYLLDCCWSKIEDLSFPCFIILFFLQLASNIGLSKPFYVHCTLYLSNKKTILFYFTYPFFSVIIVL